ncbi:MAG: cytochrome c biogenesis protein ResB [Candidatus Binatia bacterium]
MNDSSQAHVIAPTVLAKKLWRLLCSVRLALTLILLIAAASLAGALIIQAPGEVMLSSLSYDRWVESLRSHFGSFTGLLDFLGLFRIFRVWWFNALVALLMLNLAACTINRFPALWRAVRRPQVKVAQGFFEQGRYRAWFSSLTLSGQEASAVMVKALRQQRYRVTTDKEGESIHIYAERNRYSRFGTFLIHGGIILTIAAALWGNLAGFSDNGLVIPDGSIRAVGHGTDLLVLNEGFTEEYYSDGRPKDYRSDLVVYEKGREVKRQTVRVNQPLEYKGIRFHQSFFGNAAVMRVRDTISDELLFEDGVALAYRSESYGVFRPTGFFTLFDGRMEVDVVGTAQDAVDNFIQPWEVVIFAYNTDDNAMLFAQKLAQGEPFEVTGLEFTFLRERRFTGLRVVKDPGVRLLWPATALIVLGMYTVLYLPHRRVWALCSQSGQQSTLALAGAAPRLSGFDGAFQRLVAGLEKELGTTTSSQGDGEERGL